VTDDKATVPDMRLRVRSLQGQRATVRETLQSLMPAAPCADKLAIVTFEAVVSAVRGAGAVCRCRSLAKAPSWRGTGRCSPWHGCGPWGRCSAPMGVRMERGIWTGLKHRLEGGRVDPSP
jgi:hypothetical protein